MRVHSIRAKNYRPFAVLEEIKFGKLATIIGQNDAGKSNILNALQLFFKKGKANIDEIDVHSGAEAGDDVEIEIAFTSLPESIELEEDVETTLQEEMLVDNDGYLRIKKTYPRENLTKPNISLVVCDFVNDGFVGLAELNEKKLNERCAKAELDAPKSGRGITNKSKRDMLRKKAQEEGIELNIIELPLKPNDNLWKKIEALLPEFILFETDTKLGIGETTFQKEFRPIVKAATEQADVVEGRDALMDAIEDGLQTEINVLFDQFKKYSDSFTELTAKPEFSWDKAVTLKIHGKDSHDVEISLDRRGSGIRRLLMVAFFQYLAKKGHEGIGDFIFAVEEPENCLHPGLQRELVTSFRELTDEGFQVIISSHSPVFAGSSPKEHISLVIREAGMARAIQFPDLDLVDVAEQLGVEPADQIAGYAACIFVEGPSDITFFRTAAKKLKEDGHIQYDFEDKNIGFGICGGDNLKHWINLRAMERLNSNFGVVVDSDRRSQEHGVPQRKLNWKEKCEEKGGMFFILSKRDIENYLHRDAIARSGLDLQDYDDFADMKEKFGESVYKVIESMTADEILEMDAYQDGDTEGHELKEIIQQFLTLSTIVP